MQGLRRLRRTFLRALCLCAALFAAVCCHAATEVTFATWNMKWFPSGHANKKMSESTERRHMKAAGEALGQMMDCTCPTNGNYVLLLQEVRDEKSCKSLLRYASLKDASLSSFSEFTDSAGIPLWQQVCIASNLPVIESGFAKWLSRTPEPAPRGYAFAVFQLPDGEKLACFSIHLKSNLNLSGSSFGQQRNIYLREVASSQMLAKIKSLRQTYGADLRVLVGGDFNTDTDDARFISEATLRSFYGAHFRNCFTGLKLEDRVTRAAEGPYPDATFDYILYYGFSKMTGRYLFPGTPYSDHNFVAISLED